MNGRNRAGVAGVQKLKEVKRFLPSDLTDIRDGYACGWCQIEDGQLTLVPHPDSPEKIRTFRYPAEAEIVGRVTGIAMRINGEDVVSLEEPFRGPNSAKR